MLRHWKPGLFLLLGGLVLALHLGHWLMPASHPLVPAAVPQGWLSTAHAGHRGYFRHVLELPFLPEHAWMAVAADDYQLYVNGTLVAENLHLTASGSAFQQKLSVRAQSLTQGEVFELTRLPTLQKAACQESRMVQFHDIRRWLGPGRNVLAVYAQSDSRDNLAVAVAGAVSAGAHVLAIPGEPAAWRAATEATCRRGKYWYDPVYDDLAWEPARPHAAPHDYPTFAALDPHVWQTPFTAQPITVPVPRDEIIFRTTLPAVLTNQGGWLRVRASWRYDAFVGETWVGAGGGSDQVDAFDITSSLRPSPEPLTIRLYRLTPTTTADPVAEVPWLAVDGAVGDTPICSGPGWTCLTSLEGKALTGGNRASAIAHQVSEPPERIVLQVPNVPDRHWFTRFFKTVLLTTAALAAGAWLLARVCRRDGKPSVSFACWLLSPALLSILVQEVLRFRFRESDTLLDFLAPAHAGVLLAIAPVVLLASLLLLTRVRAPQGRLFRLPDRRRALSFFGLALVCLAGLVLRVWTIDSQPTHPDENVSWDAARGILRTGTPEFVSGILYTRSPLYHYLLAGWLALFGDTLLSGRCFSLLPGVAVIPAVYALVFAVSRRRYLALFAALAMALDPWLLGMCNLVRFYQQMQFFTVLGLLLFLKGFIWKEGKRYQNLFFLCAAAGVLSQEIFATMFPALLLAFLLYYRPFRWRQDRNVWVGFTAMMIVCLLDVFTYGIVCLTPHVAVSTQSESLFVLHFTDLYGGIHSILAQLSTVFYWLDNGANFFVTVFFFAGLLYWLRFPDRAMLVLYLVVLLTVPTLTILVVPINTRYVFGIYPLFVAAAILSADALVRRAARCFAAVAALATPARRWRVVVGGILLAGWVYNGEFHKVVSAHDRIRFMDYSGAMAYVAQQRRPGDALMALRTPEGAICFRGVDYYAMVGDAWFDTVYMTKHGIADRWVAGRLVWNPDQFREVFQHHDRLWIVIDEVRLRRMHPGVADYLFQTCSVEYEFFGGQVLLWDKAAGRAFTLPDKGGAFNGY